LSRHFIVEIIFYQFAILKRTAYITITSTVFSTLRAEVTFKLFYCMRDGAVICHVTDSDTVDTFN